MSEGDVGAPLPVGHALLFGAHCSRYVYTQCVFSRGIRGAVTLHAAVLGAGEPYLNEQVRRVLEQSGAHLR